MKAKIQRFTPAKSVSVEEQETSISLSPQDRTAVVYSSVPGTIMKLYRYAMEHPAECQIESDDGYGVICNMPVDWIKFQPRKKRTYSEEQKKEMAKRLALSKTSKRNDEGGDD